MSQGVSFLNNPLSDGDNRLAGTEATSPSVEVFVRRPPQPAARSIMGPASENLHRVDLSLKDAKVPGVR